MIQVELIPEPVLKGKTKSLPLGNYLCIFYYNSNPPPKFLSNSPVPVFWVPMKQFGSEILVEVWSTPSSIEYKNYNNIKPEFKFSDGTRFDFLLSNNKEKCILEVKNVTLMRRNKLAEFPDSITSRGSRHLNELCLAIKKNYKSYILYLIQKESCDSFEIAKDIDNDYKIAFDKALKCGVKILCYNCKLTNEEIILNNQIIYEK